MRFTVSVVLAIGIIAILFAAGCADITVKKQVGDFGATFGTSSEEQKAIDWFIKTYGDPRTNNGQPPRFIEPLITTGVTDKNMPVDKVAEFPVSGGSVFFWVIYDNFKKGDKIDITWTYLENGNVVTTVSQQAGDDFGRFIAEFQKPGSGWGKGRQKITVSGSGTSADVTFSIGDTLKTVPLPYEPGGVAGPVTIRTTPIPVISDKVTTVPPATTGTQIPKAIAECRNLLPDSKMVNCPAGCKDLNKDPDNCGSCGYECKPPKEGCVAGKCADLKGIPGQWNGYWNYKWGGGWPDTLMTLVQTGDTVTGTYDFRYGTITGTVQGERLTGTWTETDPLNPSKGPFEFLMSGDGGTFSAWYHTEPFALGDWEYMKTQPPERRGTRVTGPYTWTGSWMASVGGSPVGPFDTPMTLVQNGNSVTGTYDISNGKITGTVQGGGVRLEGLWGQDNVQGEYPIAFVLIDRGNFIYGTWSNQGEGVWEDVKASGATWWARRVS